MCRGVIVSSDPHLWIFCDYPCGGLPLASSDGAGAAKETAVPNSVVATTPFHLAIPVHDVHAAREFFGGYCFSHHV